MRLKSWLRAIVNTLVGYVLMILAQIYLLPYWGFHPNLKEAAEIGMLFNVISVLRQVMIDKCFRMWYGKHI